VEPGDVGLSISVPLGVFCDPRQRFSVSPGLFVTLIVQCSDVPDGMREGVVVPGPLGTKVRTYKWSDVP